ncbi:MAG TPA: NHL repeat-containing protein, partial [Melioribacteraceae bacterium]|nr:NHL repeat-containing protein [Melioribacteraceae bacterium]
MFAYILLIFMSLTFCLQAQIANVVPEKTLLLNQKVTNLGDIANVYVDDFLNYYVLSKDNKNINIFNSSGELVKKIPADNNTKLFDNPVDLCVQKNGKIAVLDKGLKRLIIVNQDGERQAVYGNSGSNLGNLDNPAQVDFDSYGNYYVFDKGNKTVIKFNKQGLYRGAIAAKNCISFAVGLDQCIHLLTKADNGFVIQVYYPNFTIKKQLTIRNITEPTDFVINKFNQYYINDIELCSVFHYDSTGMPTGIKIGIKGSSGSVGTFSDPTFICSQYVSDLNDKIYVFDEKFSSIQSFNLNFKEVQQKPTTPLVKMDVEFVESQKMDFYKYLYIYNDIFYYILNDNTLLAKKGSEEIFRLTKEGQKQKGINLSEPIALTVYNNKMYVVDNDDNKVVIIDASNGFNLSQFGESGSNEGQLKAPNDIASDLNGKIYVSDYKNNRINIYNEQGMYINKILLTNNRPLKISVSKTNTLYILMEDKKNIFYLEQDKNRIETLMLNGLSIDYEVGTIASIDENMLLVYDEYFGVIHVFENYKKIAEFLSRGENEAQMPSINLIAIKQGNNSLFVNSSKINVQKQFRLLIPPAEPKDVKINVSNDGVAELVWIGDEKRAASYLIFRKKQDEKDFQLFTKLENTKLILENPSETILQYAIIAETKDGLQSKLSANIDDELSYLLFLKDYQPQQAIKRLQELKYLNPIGIVNRISLIYRELIEKYSASSNWDMVVNSLSELIKEKPDESSTYIELANVYKTLLRYSDGIRVLNDAKIRFSDNLSVYQNLIRLQYLNKDYAGTIAMCKEALLKFADNEKIMQSLAEAYISNNQKE